MRKCKTKAIQADLGIFTHIPAYSGILRYIQAYSGIVQSYSEPSVTLAYSEIWYIQNIDIFKTRCIFRTLIYSKLWHIHNQRHIQNPGQFRTLGYSEHGGIHRALSNIYSGELWETPNGYNFFRSISFSCPLVHEIWFFNTSFIFNQVFIQSHRANICSRNIRGTFPWYIPGIFGKHSY